jgi:hypothetical protein
MLMINQLLWIEVITEASMGLALLAMPRLLIKILGLPDAATPFWPRLLGGVLTGAALATFIGMVGWSKTGLGLGGHVAINVIVSLTLLATLMLGPSPLTRRGRVGLWVLALSLLALAFVEIAHAT